MLNVVAKSLFAFNEGNIGGFEALAGFIPREPILEKHADFLRQKICLMALIERVSSRNANDRKLTFQTIMQETRLRSINEVEVVQA